MVIDVAEATERFENRGVDNAIKVNKELREIFSDDKSLEHIKYLQFSILLNASPELNEKLNKIEELAAKLKAKHGTEIIIIPPLKQDIESIENPAEPSLGEQTEEQNV